MIAEAIEDLLDFLEKHQIEPPPAIVDPYISWFYLIFWTGLGYLLGGLMMFPWVGAFIGFNFAMVLFFWIRG